MKILAFILILIFTAQNHLPLCAEFFEKEMEQGEGEKELETNREDVEALKEIKEILSALDVILKQNVNFTQIYYIHLKQHYLYSTNINYLKSTRSPPLV